LAGQERLVRQTLAELHILLGGPEQLALDQHPELQAEVQVLQD
jgi:hypothetical protein